MDTNTSMPKAGTDLSLSKNPFLIRDAPKQSFVAKVFRRPHKEGLVWAVETQLSSKPDWWSIDADELSALERQHNTLLSESGTAVLALLERAVNGLPDTDWRSGGPRAVRQLASALSHPTAADPAIEEKSFQLVRSAAARAVADDELTAQEQNDLDELARNLAISPKALADILTSLVSERILREFKNVLADSMVSPDEEQRLNRLAEQLKTRLDLSSETVAVLRDAKALWQVRHGDLPEVASPLNLQRGETCHFASFGEVMEMRQRTVRTNVSGASVRIKIMKGVYYNVGSYRASPQRENFHHSYGAGEIVLTSKRLLFNGGVKNFAIRLSNIVDFEAYSDGIEVRRSSGKPLTFVLSRTDKTFAEIFARALQDA